MTSPTRTPNELREAGARLRQDLAELERVTLPASAADTQSKSKAAERAKIDALLTPSPDATTAAEAAQATYLAAVRTEEELRDRADLLRRAITSADAELERAVAARRVADRDAVRREIHARMPQLRERLHAIATDLFLLALLDGRQGYPAQHYVGELVDGDRVNADREKRLAAIAAEITPNKETPRAR